MGKKDFQGPLEIVDLKVSVNKVAGDLAATSGVCSKPGLVSHTSLIRNKGIKLGEQSKLVGLFHDPGES